jgi:hypothetical protein
LLWVSGQEDVKRGGGDATHLFAAIHAGLITLEELFRAVHETNGLPVLHVQRENADRFRSVTRASRCRPPRRAAEPT